MQSVQVHGEPEWFGVRDPKTRKQIQDRLAQRARRRRLAQKRAQDSREDTSSSSSREHSRALAIGPERSPLNTSMFAMLESSAWNGRRGQIAAEVPTSVFSALYINGMILGIPCSTCVPGKSLPAPDVPGSLRPTQLQLTTIHSSWVDRFPLPKLRNNFIIYEGAINEEEFLMDLFSLQGFHIIPGRASWDTDAWSMDRSFARKWGFLLK